MRWVVVVALAVMLIGSLALAGDGGVLYSLQENAGEPEVWTFLLQIEDFRGRHTVEAELLFLHDKSLIASITRTELGTFLRVYYDYNMLTILPFEFLLTWPPIFLGEAFLLKDTFPPASLVNLVFSPASAHVVELKLNIHLKVPVSNEVPLDITVSLSAREEGTFTTNSYDFSPVLFVNYAASWDFGVHRGEMVCLRTKAFLPPLWASGTFVSSPAFTIAYVWELVRFQQVSYEELLSRLAMALKDTERISKREAAIARETLKHLGVHLPEQ